MLRSRPLGESDRLLTLLSWERGKITAVAKGSRKMKSRLASGVDLFTYGHFVLFQGRNMATITQQHTKERFIHLTKSPLIYSYALYFVELIDLVLVSEEKNTEICSLLIEAWKGLGEERDYNLLARTFELKLLLLAGYYPHLEGCVNCGQNDTTFLNLKHGGLICSRCAGAEINLTPFSPGSVSLSRFLLNRSFRESKAVRASSSQKEELYKLTRGFFHYYLNSGEFKTMNYIRLWENQTQE